jgi:hypothetical protein
MGEYMVKVNSCWSLMRLMPERAAVDALLQRAKTGICDLLLMAHSVDQLITVLGQLISTDELVDQY